MSEKANDIITFETESSRFWVIVDQLRRERGLKWKEISEKTNIPQITITVSKNKCSTPSLSVCRTLADFFDVSIDYLLERSQVPYIFPERFAKLFKACEEFDDKKILMLMDIAKTIEKNC